MPGSGLRHSESWRGLQARTFHRRLRVNTTGSAGAATGSAYVSLPGCRLTHLKADFHASAAATTDTLVKADGLADGSTGRTLLTLTNSVTDIGMAAFAQPNAVDEGRAVTAATDGVEGGAFIKNGISVSIAQGDALTNCLILDLWFERLRYEVVTLVAQSGADGAGVVTRQFDTQGAGVLLGLEVDYQNVPATSDLIIKADSTSGETLFTSLNSNTDFGPVALGIPSIDEGNASGAATDGIGGGAPFRTGLFFDVAQTDAFTSGDEKILVHCWIRP